MNDATIFHISTIRKNKQQALYGELQSLFCNTIFPCVSGCLLAIMVAKFICYTVADFVEVAAAFHLICRLLC